MAKIARQSNSDNLPTIIYIVDIFSSFLQKESALNFISNDPEKKKQLYKSLFNIGVNCVENNLEDGLKRVSNALGWYVKYSIDQGTVDLTKYLIERICELNNISENMKISFNTQIFMLTLFTTIGTYCCKNKAHNQFLDTIFSYLKNVDSKEINTAIALRTSENDIWDKLFDNNTAKLTKEFLNKFDVFCKNNK